MSARISQATTSPPYCAPSQVPADSGPQHAAAPPSARRSSCRPRSRARNACSRCWCSRNRHPRLPVDRRWPSLSPSVTGLANRRSGQSISSSQCRDRCQGHGLTVRWRTARVWIFSTGPWRLDDRRGPHPSPCFARMYSGLPCPSVARASSNSRRPIVIAPDQRLYRRADIASEMEQPDEARDVSCIKHGLVGLTKVSAT